MHSNALVALAALSATVVSAQRTCTQSTITITAAAQATNIGCDVVEGTILIADESYTQIDLEGPKQVGSLVVNNTETLQRLSSTTINAIHDTWSMSELNGLSSLSFTALRTIGSIKWEHLDQLDSFDFGEGVTEAEDVVISDTFLSTLNGLNLETVKNLDLNNNVKLALWDSPLANVTDTLKVTDNGRGRLVANLPNLVWANNLEARQVMTLNMPSLIRINGSLGLLENEFMESFSADNVTRVDSLSISNNEALTNITMPALTETTEFSIVNNSALMTIDGFPNLETIRGALSLRGDFTEVELPSLDTVFGQATITSTDDISDACEFFDQKKDDGDIRGDDYTCTSNNENANDAGDDGESGDSNGDDDDDGDGAGMLSVNIFAAVGVAVIGSLAIGAL